MRKIGLGFIAVWGFFLIGWIANIAQVFIHMPATFAAMTPMFIAKVVCIFAAPVGSILGWVGMFV